MQLQLSPSFTMPAAGQPQPAPAPCCCCTTWFPGHNGGGVGGGAVVGPGGVVEAVAVGGGAVEDETPSRETPWGSGLGLAAVRFPIAFSISLF